MKHAELAQHFTAW